MYSLKSDSGPVEQVSAPVAWKDHDNDVQSVHVVWTQLVNTGQASRRGFPGNDPGGPVPTILTRATNVKSKEASSLCAAEQNALLRFIHVSVIHIQL